MKRIKVIPLVAAAMALAGCLPFRPNFNPQPITQLQLRAIQTRTYDGQDPVKALKVVFNVLQDDGFVVRYGNTDLGLINASKSIIDATSNDFLSAVGSNVVGDSGSTITSVSGAVLTLEATANVSRFGPKTRVRINFERKVTDRDGRIINVSEVDNSKFYQEFFVKVDKGLFIDAQGL